MKGKQRAAWPERGQAARDSLEAARREVNVLLCALDAALREVASVEKPPIHPDAVREAIERLRGARASVEAALRRAQELADLAVDSLEGGGERPSTVRALAEKRKPR
jgi:hypothetical protein